MSQQTPDLRLRRTQKLLREALVALIEEHGFEALTVREITARAMVSRAAFYRNYQDKYDLVEQIFAEMMDVLFKAVSDSGTEHPPQVWVRFFEHIADYERLYRALLGEKGSPWFARKMRSSLADLLQQYQRHPQWPADIAQSGDTLRNAFVSDLIVTLFVEAITWWLERGRPYPPDEMAKRCVLLASAMFRETSTWQ